MNSSQQERQKCIYIHILGLFVKGSSFKVYNSHRLQIRITPFFINVVFMLFFLLISDLVVGVVLGVLIAVALLLCICSHVRKGTKGFLIFYIYTTGNQTDYNRNRN